MCQPEIVQEIWSTIDVYATASSGYPNRQVRSHCSIDTFESCSKTSNVKPVYSKVARGLGLLFGLGDHVTPPSL